MNLLGDYYYSVRAILFIYFYNLTFINLKPSLYLGMPHSHNHERKFPLHCKYRCLHNNKYFSFDTGTLGVLTFIIFARINLKFHIMYFTRNDLNYLWLLSQ